MDIFQVREAFLRGTLAEERIREFRKRRIASLENIDSRQPITMLWALFHVVSVPAMMRSTFVDARTIYDSATNLRTFGGYPDAPVQYNLDGVRKERAASSVQVYRDGRIEGKTYLGRTQSSSNAPPGSVVVVNSVRDAVRAGLKDYVRFLEDLTFPPPYAAMLTLANTKGIMFSTATNNVNADRDILEIPDVLIPDTQTVSLAAATLQVTDMLYQALGQSGTDG
jgi:hypothetical protein